MREPYTLPDDQCERLKRSEMTAVRMLLAGLSTAGYAREDLQERLKAVPDGNGRMRRSIGLLKEQEAVEPEVEVLNEIDRIYRCPKCHKCFFYEKQKYCDQCGQEVQWE